MTIRTCDANRYRFGKTRRCNLPEICSDHFPDMFPPALRRIHRFAPPAFNKLMSLDWRYSSQHLFAATDAKYLLMNCGALCHMRENWTNFVGYAAFLLLHEGWHALGNHPIRLSASKAPDRDRAFMAADYVTNHAIYDINIKAGKVCGGEYPFPFIEGALFDPELTDGLSVEETYIKLWQPGGKGGKGKEDKPGEKGTEAGFPSGQPDGKEDGKGENGDARGGEQGTGDKEGGLTDGGSGKGSQGDSTGTDEEENGNGNDATQGDPDGEGTGDSEEVAPRGKFPGTGTPDLLEPQAEKGKSVEEVEREINEQNNRVIINQQLNEHAGIGGDGFGRMLVQGQQNPVTDWKEHLKRWLFARAASGWNRPFNAPIYSSTGLVCAGREMNIIDELVIGVDVSGSVTDEKTADMFSHIVNGLREIRFNTAHLLICDYVIRRTITIEANDVDSFPTQFTDGGGGTALEPYFDWQEQHAPTAPLIILTDGFSTDLKHIQEPAAPVLWLSWGIAAEDYPFGDAIKIWQ